MAAGGGRRRGHRGRLDAQRGGGAGEGAADAPSRPGGSVHRADALAGLHGRPGGAPRARIWGGAVAAAADPTPETALAARPPLAGATRVRPRAGAAAAATADQGSGGERTTPRTAGVTAAGGVRLGCEGAAGERGGDWGRGGEAPTGAAPGVANSVRPCRGVMRTFAPCLVLACLYLPAPHRRRPLHCRLKSLVWAPHRVRPCISTRRTTWRRGVVPVCPHGGGRAAGGGRPSSKGSRVPIPGGARSSRDFGRRLGP